MNNTSYECFKNKVCLVTGGCSGIGRAAAMKFASQEAIVVIFDHQDDDQRTITQLKAINGRCLSIAGDVSNEEDVSNAIRQIEATYGRLDHAFNNAGIGGEFAEVADYPTEDWLRVMSTNLTGVFLSMKYQIPLMLKSWGSSIVNCASVLSTVAYVNDSAYVASKFGVLGLTKNAALEYAGKGLRINSVSPGFTCTPMIDNGDKSKLARIASKHPIGRLATAEEIAEGVLWLCSDSASFAVGMNLLIDGGYTLA